LSSSGFSELLNTEWCFDLDPQNRIAFECILATALLALALFSQYIVIPDSDQSFPG